MNEFASIDGTIHLDINRPHLAFAEAARRLGLEVPGLQGPAR